MRKNLGALLVFLFFAIGCTVSKPSVGTVESTPEMLPVSDDVVQQRIEPFVTAVSNTGTTVEIKGISPESMFAAPMVRLLVDEQNVTLFAYADTESRQVVSQQLSPDGSELIVKSEATGEIATTIIDWVDIPHFWTGDHLIIQYIGQNQATIDLFDTLYGAQIADGSIPHQPAEIGTGPTGGFGPLGDDVTGGISLQYDLYLLYSAIPHRAAAEPASPEYGHAPAAPGPKPERIIITLQSDKFPESTYQPQIIISAEPFPATTLLNGEMVSAAEQAITFQNGEGVRWVAQEMGQAATPVNNSDLVYLFQGKTYDEQFFVYATIPVSHPDLPDNENDVTNYEELLTDWGGYINEMQSMLHNQPPQSFVPDLTVIDAMLATLNVEPTAPLSGPAERGFMDAPRLVQGFDAAQIKPGVVVDYWEIRNESWESGQQIIAQSGERDGLETAVLAQLDATTGPEWCGKTTTPSCNIYIVSVTGREVRPWIGNTGISEFLGTIDTAEEAVLLAAAYDYGASQSSIGSAGLISLTSPWYTI